MDEQMQSLSDILATTQKGSSRGTVGGKTTFLDELGRGLDGLDGGGQEREAPARVDVPDLHEGLVVEARAAPPEMTALASTTGTTRPLNPGKAASPTAGVRAVHASITREGGDGSSAAAAGGV